MPRTTLCPLIVLLGSVTAAPLWAADLVGTVKSIDQDRTLVTVTQEVTGKEVVVSSGEHTVIKTADRGLAGLADLRPGSHVLIREDLASEIIIAQRSTGRVKSIDSEGRTLVVTDDQTGRDVARGQASPTLPLAASLGLTFSYNVTIGIPVYLEIAKLVMRTFPV